MRKLAFWLSLIMIFTIPWENMITITSLGTVSRAMGYIVAGFWALTVVVTGRFRALRMFHGIVYLFVLWSVVSVFWSVNIDKTVTRFLTSIQLAGLILMLWDLYTTPAMLRAGLQAYVLGGFVSISSAIGNYISDSQFYPRRYSATGFNVNDLAIILALGIPVAWYLAMSEEGGKKALVLKLVDYLYIPAAMIVIMLAASRTALVSTFPAFLFMLGTLTRLKLYVRVLIVVLVVGSLLALLPFIPESSFQRLGTTESEVTDGDWNGRLAIWEDGITSFQEHPLIGVGSGAFAEITDTGKVGHNFVLSLLVEVGIIGFSLFMIILVIAFKQARRQPRVWARLWLTILSIWLLGAASHNLEYRKQSWLFLSLVVVSASLFGRRDVFGAPPALQPVGAVMAGGRRPFAGITLETGARKDLRMAQLQRIQTPSTADRLGAGAANRSGLPLRRNASQGMSGIEAHADAQANEYSS